MALSVSVESYRINFIFISSRYDVTPTSLEAEMRYIDVLDDSLWCKIYGHVMKYA